MTVAQTLQAKIGDGFILPLAGWKGVIDPVADMVIAMLFHFMLDKQCGSIHIADNGPDEAVFYPMFIDSRIGLKMKLIDYRDHPCVLIEVAEDAEELAS